MAGSASVSTKPDLLPSLRKRGVGGEFIESIHPGVSSLLTKLHLSGAEHSATRAYYTGIQAGNIYTPLGEDSGGPWKGMHIDREVFHAKLLQRVCRMGAEAKFNTEVVDFLQHNDRVGGVKTNDLAAHDLEASEDTRIFKRHTTGIKDLHASYIIDAAGHTAIAGRKLKFKRKFFSSPLACWTGISNSPPTPRQSVAGSLFQREGSKTHCECAYFIPHKTGWTWLAPIPPDHCAWTRLSPKGEKSFLPPEELRSCTVVGKIHTSNRRWRLYRPVCTEGVVLCGDAAGILDPAAGQGIFNALMSGMYAGETVVSCLKQPEMESFYLAKYDGWFVTQYEEKAEKLAQYYRAHGIFV